MNPNKRTDPEKQKKLRLLQKKYILKLPEYIAFIQNAWSEVQNNLLDDKARHTLSQHAHSLAGSAGTFGFSNLSVQSRNLEQQLNMLQQGKSLTNDTIEKLTQTIEQIKKLASYNPDSIEQRLSTITTPDIKTQSNLVYIFEKDITFATEITKYLNLYGYEVTAFTDAIPALKAMQQCIPNIIIIDIDFQKNILTKSLTSNNNLIIFISDRSDWKSRLTAVRAGGDAYLIKPIDFNDLLDKLELITDSQEIESYRILVVDDMPILAEHYASVLENAGMQVKFITEPSKLLGTVSEFKPELILMDIFMPECSGLEAAKIIRQQQDLMGVPIVFLSTESDTQQQLSALKTGGDDFLQKPINDTYLVDSVLIRVERFRKLSSLMHEDSLTGLYNHVTIKMHLESEMARTIRQNSTLVFAMLDIDHFKLVNDQYGHPVGDQVIKSLSRLLIQRLRKSDIIGRYGGEEFAIVLPDTSIESAKTIVNDIRHQFSSIVHQHNDQQFSCSFSTGLAIVPGFIDATALIRAADDALYLAKQDGRNCTRIYTNSD